VRKRGERIVGLADAVVERAFRAPDTAKIESRRDVAHREEGLGERLRDLVVERAALLRMRMRDQRDAARRRLGDSSIRFRAPPPDLRS
jgi:hypothetical protein